MKTIEKQGAQGDVLFRRIDKLPKGAKEQKTEAGRIVVAHSETGHHHAIDAHGRDVVMHTVEKDPMVCYLQIESDFADVVHHRPHDTHETMRLLNGCWEVRRQREHTPQGWRQVAD